ncbi:GntR family transcriptional regulator [Planomonospora parontospora subsp. parontospora]|uniref:GntR family transcriptional regulator n=2 Tax=Planomonospora parontospora TaxID=58119 RepID=A0AA37BF56_9ACTN|nr:GntR family transcriptional regulator [Planomonospora parontospora]GII12307.1 GntR family transcriptional regulator [Planomonospora parontospora subsp. parontospora]
MTACLCCVRVVKLFGQIEERALGRGMAYLYVQVADDLRRRIQSGEFPAGSQIPTREQINKQYKVSAAVAIKALSVLVTEGLVESRPGAGAYVLPPRERLQLSRERHREVRGGSPFAGDMETQGKTPRWRAHSRSDAATAEVARRLGIAEGDPVMRTVYVYTADDEPVQRAVSWEPYELTRGTPIAFPEDGPHGGRGVRDRMAVIGVTVTHRREALSSRGATVEEARDLGIATGAVVTVLRRTYFTDDRPVETADIVAAGDRTEFVYVLPIS